MNMSVEDGMGSGEIYQHECWGWNGKWWNIWTRVLGMEREAVKYMNMSVGDGMGSGEIYEHECWGWNGKRWNISTWVFRMEREAVKYINMSVEDGTVIGEIYHKILLESTSRILSHWIRGCLVVCFILKPLTLSIWVKMAF